MRQSYRMFEDEAYISETPVASSSESSRPKRARVYELLEGLSEGLTDPATDDGSSRGATSRGSVSISTDSASDDGDSRGSPSGRSEDTLTAEPGWLVE